MKKQERLVYIIGILIFIGILLISFSACTKEQVRQPNYVSFDLQGQEYYFPGAKLTSIVFCGQRIWTISGQFPAASFSLNITADTLQTGGYGYGDQCGGNFQVNNRSGIITDVRLIISEVSNTSISATFSGTMESLNQSYPVENGKIFINQ